MVTPYLDRIAEHVAERADRLALVDDDGVVTYGRLWAEAHAAARNLAACGVGSGDVVGLWLPNGRAWVRSFLGASLLGATTLCVNTGLGPQEIATLLRRARPRVLVLAARLRGRDPVEILTAVDPAALVSIESLVVEDRVVEDGDHDGRDGAGSDEWSPRLRAALGRPVVPGPGSVDLDTPAPAPAPASIGGTPAVIFTSSGTTGEPKLVVHTVHGLSGHVAAVARSFGMEDPDARVLAPMPFCGVMGLETLLSGLVAGAVVATLRGFDAKRAASLIEQYSVTVTACSDEALRRVLDAAEPDGLRSLRDVALAVFGGDPHPLLERARAADVRAFQTYGSSEVHALLCFPPPQIPREELAVGGGRPVLADYRARARRDGITLPDGEPGALELQSPFLFAGYLDTDGRLVRVLSADGWFATGDLGHTYTGGFAYLARESDALRLGGYLVEPREIEQFLEQLPGVDAAVVVGAQNDGRTLPVAFLRAEAAAPWRPDEETVIERCRAALARFKVPAAVEWTEAFPVTDGPNGVKIRRSELREHAEVLVARRRTVVPS